MSAPLPSAEELFIRYGATVFRRCRQLLGNDAAAEDAAQEVFIRILNRSDTFRGEATALTWVFDPHRVHLETCTQGAARLATMRAEGVRYLDSAAAQRVRERMAVRPSKVATPWWHRAIWLGAPALVAAALVVIVARPTDDGLLRPKGAGVLGWEGQPLQRGDRVQPTWTASVDGEVALIAREPNGECTVLFALEGDKSARVRRGRAGALGDNVNLER